LRASIEIAFPCRGRRPPTVSENTISGNSATNAGVHGIASGGGIYDTGTLTVTGCTISGNSAIAAGDGSGFAEGGAIITYGTLTVIDSTISGNPVAGGGDGGGVFVAGSTGMGSSNVYNPGLISPPTQSVTVTLPAGEPTLYVSFRQLSGGVWQPWQYSTYSVQW